MWWNDISIMKELLVSMNIKIDCIASHIEDLEEKVADLNHQVINIKEDLISCVSMSRAAITERKDLQEKEYDNSNKIFNSSMFMLNEVKKLFENFGNVN